jgi:peptidoglycan/LPS O-acetylase OafA/YrhL
MKLSYRTDIDGLRAVAVGSVIFYHMGFSGFAGGFVGVDVFFVISGYLISSIVRIELSSGCFTLSNFWFRRAKRILPALFAVLAVTMVASWFIQMPNDFKNFGRSIFAQSFFASNIYFWLKSGYFNEMAETMPLLNTWSLSVEEQFYLLFPIIFSFLWFCGKNIRLFFLALFFFVSLWFSEILVISQREAVFFLLPTRAFELLIGVLLAEIEYRQYKIRNILTLEVIAGIGLFSIVLAVMTFNQNTRFPGISALLPCMGAALIIYTGRERNTLVSKILSTKGLVWIGLISYSLYLWHWPILVYARYMLQAKLSYIELFALLLGILSISVVSYNFIEIPFRKSSKKMRIAVFSILGTIIALLSGGLVNANNGFPNRIPSAILNEYEMAFNYPKQQCKTKNVGNGVSVCTKKQVSALPDIVLWGDSHAGMLLPLMEGLADKYNVNLWSYSCIPVLGVYDTNKSNSTEESLCLESNGRFLEFLDQKTPKIILLASFWSQFVEGREQPMEGAGQVDPFYGDKKTHSTTRLQAREVFKRNFLQTVDEFEKRGITVYIMKQVPIFRYWVPNRLTKMLRYGGDLQTIRRPLKEHKERMAYVDEVFKSIQADDIVLLDPTKILCKPDGFCYGISGKSSLYRDFNHLSYQGTKQLISLFEPIFESLENRVATKMQY